MRKEEIDMIDKTMAKHGRNVVGATYIEYPVYLVHLEYKKKSDDPMFFIDWAIMKFITQQPMLDKMSVSKIIGLDEQLIKHRLYILKEDGYILEDEKGYKITRLGEDAFLNEKEEAQYINVSSDFLIDGKDLTIMPSVFYSDKGYITFDENSIYPRTIIRSSNDTSVRKLLGRLEKMSNVQKVNVGLPAESKDFRTTDIPSQGVLRLFLVFSQNENHECFKDLVYGEEIIEIHSLQDVKDKSYFSDRFEFNYGYDSMAAHELKNTFLSFTTNGIKQMLSYMYGWEQVDQSWYRYGQKEQRSPLMINLTMDNLRASKKRGWLLTLLRRKYHEYNNNRDDMFVRILLQTEDESLLKLSEFNNDLYNSKTRNNLRDISKLYEKYGKEYVRRSMIFIDKLEYLEEIDIKEYVR